jgi:hypothetical protein
MSLFQKFLVDRIEQLIISAEEKSRLRDFESVFEILEMHCNICGKMVGKYIIDPKQDNPKRGYVEILHQEEFVVCQDFLATCFRKATCLDPFLVCKNCDNEMVGQCSCCSEFLIKRFAE